MKVRVRLFAVAREIAGADSVEIAIVEPLTARAVVCGLVEQMPDLERVVRHSLLAVNGELAADDARISPEAEIALIPPVSGG